MNKYLHRFEENKYIILLFHGVINKHTNSVRNYNRKHIDVDYFEKVIKEFSEFGNVISMDELILLQKKGEGIKERSFIVTFDEGFANNLEIAAPILREYNIPATFYVTTDFIDNNSMSWIDRIEYVIEKTEVKSISLSWLRENVNIENNLNKIEALDEIRRYVKSNSNFNVNEFISQLYQQLDEIEVFSSDDILDRKMNWEELKELNSYPLFTIGGHTHSHPIMAFLSDEKLEDEVSKCLNLLKSKAEISATHFSYPEGQSNHYNENVIRKLKEKGIICCPSAIDGVNYLSEDLFNLKRITIV